MQAVGRRTQPKKGATGGGRFPLSRLSLYEDSPSADVDVESFESHGIARLQVLRRIDVLQARGVRGDRLHDEINKADLEHLFADGTGAKDRLSHFILRVAYCHDDELRKWLLTQELLLFKIRFQSATPAEVDRFLGERQFLKDYPPINMEEKMRLKPKLMALFHDGLPMTEHAFSSTVYYKVPFQDVLQPVARREAYLAGGLAYVSRADVLSIIDGKYRASLSKSLAQLCQVRHQITADPRLGPIVQNLGRVAFKYGGSALEASTRGGLDTRGILDTFLEFIKGRGHSDPKTKAAGASKMFVSTGSRRPNECDLTCPIAGRVHKGNTQKYTVFFDTLVMQRGCWDGDCIAKGRHLYYQIQEGGRVKEVGWEPPPLDAATIARVLKGRGEGGVDDAAAADGAAAEGFTPPEKKMKLMTP